ncbi:serine hydrolase [Pontixanthobacter aestiaquae]|uniref:Serine hydrolase n=1 Tax=Pontixanthobacter aestiaquae TaxID=1509367 RepID=A0A844Z985_9SPHN|nr:serine hydrolase [Pontixanthobacter aestiaquae]MDN3645242.1 serine hydrolase [Pontixanthobacter aestiaquae]MXO83756.1 serine hydrolase [Pontixanthobacter aestiaquae]
MKKWIIGILIVLLAGGGVTYASLDKDQRALLANMPTDRNVLFWSDEQREIAFRTLDAIPILANARVIEAGDTIKPLPEGEPLSIPTDVDAYMEEQRTAAIVILHDGKLVFERYGLGFDADGKWTSFSVAKSFTSTLVGAAVKDGYIKSLDDKVTDYIDGLKGSAYDDVSVRQLLTMTSGVRWNEDYTDPQSDVALFNEHQAEEGEDVTVSYMKTLPRDVPAGEQWVYSTGETNLIGVLVSEATGKALADYLSEKVWAPYGMQQDATWLLGSTGHEISGCCIQAATRDYARFGEFIRGGAMVGGESIVPADWLEQATTKQADIGAPGSGYGYQWWTYDDGSFAAQGIFGQGIFIDPARKLVIASNSNWPNASGQGAEGKQRTEFYRAVQQAVDALERAE